MEKTKYEQLQEMSKSNSYLVIDSEREEEAISLLNENNISTKSYRDVSKLYCDETIVDDMLCYFNGEEEKINNLPCMIEELVETASNKVYDFICNEISEDNYDNISYVINNWNNNKGDINNER